MFGRSREPSDQSRYLSCIYLSYFYMQLSRIQNKEKKSFLFSKFFKTSGSLHFRAIPVHGIVHLSLSAGTWCKQNDLIAIGALQQHVGRATIATLATNTSKLPFISYK